MKGLCQRSQGCFMAKVRLNSVSSETRSISQMDSICSCSFLGDKSFDVQEKMNSIRAPLRFLSHRKIFKDGVGRDGQSREL